MAIKISIVIPNYNGGKTLENALLSLFNQQYHNLEVIVVDGKSTDNSIDIIKKYENQIDWWVSEPDSGQSNAISKGFSRCTGEVINWLCSDDLLAPNSLDVINRSFSCYPEVDVLVGAGKIEFTGNNDNVATANLTWLKHLKNRLGLQNYDMVAENASFSKPSAYIKKTSTEGLALMPAQCSISQPSCFYRKSLLKRTPPVDESYHYAMDTELWNYFKTVGAKWHCIEDVLSVSIQDGCNKTSTGGYKIALELDRIYRTYSKDLIPLTFWQKHLRFPLERYIMKNPNRHFSVFLASLLWGAISLLLVPFYGFSKVKAMRWTRWA